ncbi:MetQ/NlpA family ABC transporter substrate-binding protein [Vagococcus xieshaowenii]|uniref:Lipoprotein n=1 Tax=Vagococcus xieshaowenii TaxID=2562451 RepID=A0AAJ5EG70_9ENTE|nr:MetQ/NlpA family ABC transporter substrate-binding protein [Vagococcus xieshaowenii]QCA28843.1 MetQ/NlpA family ABC transporter substrate-binding protein [Vagococcus xieshaowenii]TFZ43450.1 MetQ/NlpA family ABC transporter substrate-binding protein [Vagococcus xieshaowenii]
MKKRVLTFLSLAALTIGLAACGSNNKEKSTDDNVLKVGASPTPHAEILEHIKPKLAQEGVELEIVEFQDYILPNKALSLGELDANYFQHIPYFEQAVKDNGYDFTNAGSAHIELMAFYSQSLKDIKELKDGATVLVSNSSTDWGRVITILQQAGLVKVKDGVDLLTATFDDIEENPKQLVFKYDVNPELLTTAYKNNEADLVAINANFAETIGLAPEQDGVLVEENNSPYANIVAVNTKDKDNEKIKKLMDALHDEDTQTWIKEKWNGKIMPVK